MLLTRVEYGIGHGDHPRCHSGYRLVRAMANVWFAAVYQSFLRLALVRLQVIDRKLLELGAVHAQVRGFL